MNLSEEIKEHNMDYNNLNEKLQQMQNKLKNKDLVLDTHIDDHQKTIQDLRLKLSESHTKNSDHVISIDKLNASTIK